MEEIAVVDWRERTFALYERVRSIHEHNPQQAAEEFRSARDELFKTHAASPLDSEQVQAFEALPFFNYAPDFNIQAELRDQSERESFEIELSDDGLLTITRIASAHFSINTLACALPVYWIEGYGGGIFLPFKDATNGTTSYGGGRYLFDTRKGANLGLPATSINLDFNFAYNPSCAYNPRWSCPLARPESTLDIAIEAGERYHGL